MNIYKDRNQWKSQKRQRAYDRAYRRTSFFLAGFAAPIIGRKLNKQIKNHRKK